MMKKNSNKGKKSLTAVGAVVAAAGLAPGAIAAVPSHSTILNVTAAEVVAIGGNAYGFDELYAMQRENSVDTIEMHIVLEPDPNSRLHDQIGYGGGATRYGVRGAHSAAPIRIADEQKPQFPAGVVALMKYIEAHINYPPEAAKSNVQGEVVVRFVVNKDGSVGEVKIVRSVDKDLDQEAIRVVKSLPKFTPGHKNGEAASMWYTLSVPFKLK